MNEDIDKEVWWTPENEQMLDGGNGVVVKALRTAFQVNGDELRLTSLDIPKLEGMAAVYDANAHKNPYGKLIVLIGQHGTIRLRFHKTS